VLRRSSTSSARPTGGKARCGQLVEPRRAESLLLQRLEQQHGVRVVTPGPEMPVLEGGTLRLFDAASGVLYLSDRLEGGQRNFHMATQLAFLEMEAAGQQPPHGRDAHRGLGPGLRAAREGRPQHARRA
jgi:hypothetical protein